MQICAPYLHRPLSLGQRCPLSPLGGGRPGLRAGPTEQVPDALPSPHHPAPTERRAAAAFPFSSPSGSGGLHFSSPPGWPRGSSRSSLWLYGSISWLCVFAQRPIHFKGKESSLRSTSVNRKLILNQIKMLLQGNNGKVISCPPPHIEYVDFNKHPRFP